MVQVDTLLGNDNKSQVGAGKWFIEAEEYICIQKGVGSIASDLNGL